MLASVEEKPIIFGADSVRAILSGAKTQTRRVVKPQPYWKEVEGLLSSGWSWVIGKRQELNAWQENEIVKEMCKYSPFQVGQQLWVREAGNIRMGATLESRVADYAADTDGTVYHAWRSPIHMPRWASRITLEVTAVRVERLQAISGKDIIAEGVVARSHDCEAFALVGANPKCPVGHDDVCYPDLRSLWATHWDKINRKKHPYSSNPWVWVITFKRLTTC